MFISMKSRAYSELGHVRSKTRSLGQILEKPWVHSSRLSFDSTFMKMFVCIKYESESKLGHVRSGTRSLGQILAKPCVLSKAHSFD